MRDPSPMSSNWRSQGTLRDYLTRNDIVAIGDIDTRALTKKLRSGGVMRGIIATGSVDPQVLVEKARAVPHMEGSDLVKDVTCAEPYDFTTIAGRRGDRRQRSACRRCTAPRGRCASRPTTTASRSTSCVAWRRTAARSGCSRPQTPAAEVLAWKPDGIFLSNGPGDPAAVTYAIDNIKTLIDADVPMFGICLGHQLMGLALGAKTYKLKFGHRGGNHPVKQLDTGAIEITVAEPRLRRRPGDAAGRPRG